MVRTIMQMQHLHISPKFIKLNHEKNHEKNFILLAALSLHKETNFSIKDFFSKHDQIRELGHIKKILKGKLQFL